MGFAERAKTRRTAARPAKLRLLYRSLCSEGCVEACVKTFRDSPENVFKNRPKLQMPKKEAALVIQDGSRFRNYLRGIMFQISDAYWPMVRSELNWPLPAMFIRAMRFQAAESFHISPARRRVSA